jgi:glucose-6-phosphate isomerase
MSRPVPDPWQRFCDLRVADAELGFALDVSGVDFDAAALDALDPAMDRALAAMEALEGGAIANPDEQRMVGHYWLRAPDLAPTDDIRQAIVDTREAIAAFATSVHGGRIIAEGGAFEHVLHIGIGGSALGPQLVADALGNGDRLQVHFIDNTDPDGFDRVLAQLRGVLDRTLVTVVSKSGGTPEPRNAMLEVRAAYERAGIPHAPHFVAVTMPGSRLDEIAQTEGWLKRFPMWDWVGGRTSVMSAVGLLPAALQGLDVNGLLEGAAAMDRLTRVRDWRRNPAALLAAMWHIVGDGRGGKDMVILPYKDRLLLMSRYLQQLVMESLGKELDRSGAIVHQGLAVYGNKGSTDQHAYVQQLREGIPNFFVTFIQVLRDRGEASAEMEPGITAGDYLRGFLQGTREALRDNGRQSITITIDDVTAPTLGALIALYERTVGLYAELIDVNAYHQPGVEAGKKAAADVLDLQQCVVAHLQSADGPLSAESIAAAVGRPGAAETIYTILAHLAANDRGVTMVPGASPRETTFARA